MILGRIDYGCDIYANKFIYYTITANSFAKTISINSGVVNIFNSDGKLDLWSENKK